MHPSEREFPNISNSLPVQWMHETRLLAATFNAIIAVDFLAFFFDHYSIKTLGGSH
jgi:hypothetical protein